GDHGQLIRREPVLSPNEEVAEIDAGRATNLTHPPIREHDGSSIRHPKAPIHVAWFTAFATGRVSRTQLFGKERLNGIVVRRGQGRLHVLARVSTRIN